MLRTRPYHHGNLREFLLETAVELISEVSLAGLNLRELARRAGVSHNAPYRHFRDKGELLATLAAQGFRELNEAMLEGTANESTPIGQLKRSAYAYVAFALRRPEHFAAMFDAPAVGSNPSYVEASAVAFATFAGFIANCETEGELPPGGSKYRALVAWSLVHGIARLAVASRLPFRSHDQILQFAVRAIEDAIAVIRQPMDAAMAGRFVTA